MSTVLMKMKQSAKKAARKVEELGGKIEHELDNTVRDLEHACENTVSEVRRVVRGEPREPAQSSEPARQHRHHQAPQPQQAAAPAAQPASRQAPAAAAQPAPQARPPRPTPEVSTTGAPEEFVCPICCELMVDPMQCHEGHTLCAYCWEECLEQGLGGGRHVCPMDNSTPVERSHLVPNRSLASLIESHIKREKARAAQEQEAKAKAKSQAKAQAEAQAKAQAKAQARDCRREVQPPARRPPSCSEHPVVVSSSHYL